MAQCPFCDKPINENANQCPHCGAPIKATTIVSPTKTETKSQQGICPNCKSPVNKTDIICIYCGTNLLTGTKIVAETPKEKKSVLPPIQRKYLLYGFVVILLLIFVGIGIIYFSYDPISSAISLSRTNLLGAIDILQKYIAKNPQNIRAHLILGILYLRNNQFDESLTEFEKVISASDKNNDVIWLALIASTKKGDKTQQIKYIKLLEQKYPDRNDIKLLSILGEGKTPNVEMEQLLSLAKSSESNRNSIIALLLSTGNFDQVLSLVNNDEISPKTALLLLILSEIKKDEQNKQKFMSIIENNLPEMNDTEKALIASQLLKVGNTNRSLQLLQSLKSKEKIPTVLNYLYALALLNSGLETEAIIELEKIKNSEGNYSNDASLDLALIYFKQDNISKAMDLIQSIKNKGQQSPRCYLIEGRIALANNDVTFAQQCFSNAIQKDPNYAPAYLENGLLYIQKGVLSEGLKNLRTYIQIVKNTDPNYSTAEIEVLIEQIEQTLLNNPTLSQTNTATQ